MKSTASGAGCGACFLYGTETSTNVSDPGVGSQSRAAERPRRQGQAPCPPADFCLHHRKRDRGHGHFALFRPIVRARDDRRHDRCLWHHVGRCRPDPAATRGTSEPPASGGARRVAARRPGRPSQSGAPSSRRPHVGAGSRLAGGILINGPLIPLMVGPLFIVRSLLARTVPVASIASLILGFALAWSWWSAGATLWRVCGPARSRSGRTAISRREREPPVAASARLRGDRARQRSQTVAMAPVKRATQCTP
jgi:hypothetical protein